MLVRADTNLDGEKYFLEAMKMADVALMLFSCSVCLCSAIILTISFIFEGIKILLKI